MRSGVSASSARRRRREDPKTTSKVSPVMRSSEHESSGLMGGRDAARAKHTRAVRAVAVVGLALTALAIFGLARHGALAEQRPDVPSTSGVTASPKLGLDVLEVTRPDPVPEASPGAKGALASPNSPLEPKVYTYEIVNKYPHEPRAFTQGLIFRAPDTLFESTGSVNGPSTVREVDLVTGIVRRKTEMDRAYFAEGLTMRDGKLAQITWRNSKGFYYDPTTLERVGEFDTPLRDGWGLTTDPDGDALIVTDASEHLHFVDPSSDPAWTLVRSTPVTDGDRTIRFANELETVGDEVWANVIETECIARIDPKTGTVVGWIVMDGLRDMCDPASLKAGVLNGIARDDENDRTFVTGKQWSNLFEVRVEESDMGLDEARRKCWPPTTLPQYGYP